MAAKVKTAPKMLVSEECINKHTRWITGYSTLVAEADPNLNLAIKLGCTLAGHTAMTEILSKEDAMAARIAGRRKQAWATYIIGNLAHPVSKYSPRDPLEALHDGGWHVIAVMPGAHGTYVSYLMGASTANHEGDLMARMEAEKDLKDCDLNLVGTDENNEDD